MQKMNHKEKKQTLLWLLLIYSVSVIIRFLLALATRNYPTVSIDEFLYYSLGRSIATEGSLLYLGQPAVYNYIIYPLILSPVYLFFEHGTDYFRIIQLWNIILMSLSVFPFYGLCKEIVQARKTALWLTGLFMLLPCFILGEFIYSEAIIYPMFFSLMYCVYRYLCDNRMKYTIWIGVLGVLLYYSKPGAVLPAILALLLFAGMAISRKSAKSGIQVLAGMGCLAVGFFAVKLLAEKVLGYQGTLLSVYNDQVAASKAYNIEYFFSAIGRYPYYFVLAGGILPFLYVLRNYSCFRREDRLFYVFLMTGVLITMVGTAWIVNRPERKDILYLRYIEMYLPILLMYCVISKNEKTEKNVRPGRISKILCYLILVYITICTVVWGCTTGTGRSTDSHFLISLAVLSTRYVMGIANILIVFLSGMSLYVLVRNVEKEKLLRICCAIVTIMVLLNNIQGYVTTASNTDKKLAEESEEIHRQIGDREYIHVYAEDQSDFGLDVNSRRNIFQVSEKDFLNNIIQNRGVYVPFVPSSSRGMRAVYKTPDTEEFIVDEKIYPYIQFSSNTAGFISADKSFRVVYFNRNQRIADSVMEYDHNRTYSLKVYNEEWYQHPVKIRLEMESKTAQDMEVTAGESYTISLNEGRFWYDLTIQNPAEEYTFTARDNSVKLYGYEVKATEQTVPEEIYR